VAQVLKPDVRERIVAAACKEFFTNGYDGSSMAGIAQRAHVSTSNIYRYFPDKSALFDAVLPDDLIARHDELLDERIAALVEPIDASDAAARLLDFWLEHRLAIAILLDHDGDTTRADYRHHFVDRLVHHVTSTLDVPPTPAQLSVLRIVFDNTRRAIAHILRADDHDTIRDMIATFWSYQLPGLAGLDEQLRTRT
jgi:AcrR family transcriptional regulator